METAYYVTGSACNLPLVLEVTVFWTLPQCIEDTANLMKEYPLQFLGEEIFLKVGFETSYVSDERRLYNM